ELHKHYPPLAPSMIAGDCTPSYLYHEPAAERIWNYSPSINFSSFCGIRLTALSLIGTCSDTEAASRWISSMRFAKNKRASQARRRLKRVVLPMWSGDFMGDNLSVSSNFFRVSNLRP